MRVLKLALIGASGKMGQDLQALIKVDSGFELVACVSREKRAGTMPLSEVDGKTVDGVIDFSSPENLTSVLEWCVDNKKPVVVGTTGFVHSPKAQLTAAGKQIPVLWSPNMSLGIAYLQQAIRHFSLIRDFDFQIEEVHHTKKKDAPSGTALFLQGELKSAIGSEPPDVVSIRAGQVFGIHRVMAFGPDETIILEHQALNRSVFSKGAMKALQWLVNQPNGYYSLSDVFTS